MPYRKTRRNRKSQRQKTRSKFQKGGAGGLLRLFRRAPAQELPFESYKSSINRLFLFLYTKINPSTPGYIPLTANQKMLTLEQKEFFRSLLTPYISTNATTQKKIYRQQEFVKEVLGIKSLQTLNDEITAVESVGKPVQDIVYNRPAKGESFAGSLDRLLPVLLSSEQVIQYRQNWERGICSVDPKVDQNRPLRGLYENRCIFILHRKDTFDLILPELQLVYGDSFAIGPGLPYILVEKQYLPQMDEKPFPYTRIKSTRLLETSFVTDAFKEDGVLELQYDLGKALADEDPARWKQLPLVQIRTIRDVANLDLSKDKYLLTDNDSTVPNTSYVSLSRIPVETKIYGMDPQTSILLRTNYISLWSQWIRDPNYTFFMFLSPAEQAAIAKLQFRKFLEVFKTNPTEAIQVYELSLESKEVQDQFLRGMDIDEVWKYEKIFRKYI